MNLAIKEYCKFPKYLPLPCHLEHGWTPLPGALTSDITIADDKGMMLVYSKIRKKLWKKSSKIPVRVIGNPFIHYRRIHNIKQNLNAQGTIVFPSHSTNFLESQYDISLYCKKLNGLPKEFHPIKIYLLWPDIKLGRDEIYIKNGFEVVSAGKKIRGSLDFAKNFYEILRNHKYATSNDVGSYTLYAIELGLPFFIYGDEPTIINTEGKDPNNAKSGKTSDCVRGKQARRLFDSGTTTKILTKQIQYVLFELGINDCIGPLRLRKLLISRTKNFRYLLISLPIFHFLNLFEKIVPREISNWMIKKTAKYKLVNKNKIFSPYLINILKSYTDTYSDMISYGFHSIIKEYSRFPKYLPLPCHMEHGWTSMSEALPSDLKNNKKVMFVYSKRRAIAWQKSSDKEVFIMGSPFVLYRKMNKIYQAKDARGTIAFPSHSTKELRADFDIKKYCQVLKKIPKDYQPVTMCLHYLDISRGIDLLYKREGFDTITAGDKNNINFAKNFYNILRKHKYATSNEIGSYTFYAVEMGLPFFILGDLPLVIDENGNDPNLTGQLTMNDYKIGKYAMNLFQTSPTNFITKQQKDFVLQEIGNDEHLSAKEINSLLWKYFWKEFFFLKAPAINFFVYILRKMKRII